MWPAIARYLWTGLVVTGFATHLAPPGGWPPVTEPSPEPHPERLIPHVPLDATEQALWDQLADLPRLR